MGRAPCCEKMGLKKGPWAPEEDRILINHIQLYGHGNWRALPKQAGLLRCGKSCRLRWINYLRPDLKRGNFTREEEETIIKLHEMLGNRWSAIAARLPGRTDNEIKNVWHTHLKKRLKQNDAAPKAKRGSINTSKFNQESKTEPERPKLSNPEGSESADRRPTSSQRCSSDVSSPTTEDTFVNMSTEVELMDIFPETDDNFWTEVLSTDNSSPENDFLAFGSDPQLQYPLSPIINVTEPHHDNKSNIHDNLDFWYSLLTEAGEFPGLSSEI